MARQGVTIAIPNWNHEVFLPRSVGSALAAVKELRRHGLGGEVLVVDDQSRDGSLMLLRQLEALHFAEGLRVLALPENGGVCRREIRPSAEPAIATCWSWTPTTRSSRKT